MKKVSTEGKAREELFQPKLTIGLDLGDRSSWYCVLDERGEVVLEQKVATTPKALQARFGRTCRAVLRDLLRFSYNQDGAGWKFASQDTYFLENLSCSDLRSRAGFILAGALRGLLRALS